MQSVSKLSYNLHGKAPVQSSNRPQKQPSEVFCKKGVLKNFAIFRGKHLCWSNTCLWGLEQRKRTIGYLLGRIIWYNDKRKPFKYLRNDWLFFSYTAPKDGLYLVSANVKLQSASEKNSEFTLTVAVNSDPNTFTDQNGIQDYIQCNTGPPLAK